MYFVFGLVCLILILDIYLIKISGFGLDFYFLSTNQQVLMFIVMALAGVIGQVIIIQYVENKIRDSKTILTKYLGKLHTIFRIFQYSLATLIVLVSSQMLFTNQYNTILLMIIISFSYLIMMLLLGILSARFISWLKLYRSLVGASYALASIALLVNAMVTLVYIDYLLATKPSIIGAYQGGLFFPVSIGQILYSAYFIITIISFTLTWIATAILLYHYSHKFGKVKYWLIMISPLIYFLSQFLTLVPNLIHSLISQDPVLYSTILTLTFTTTKIVGGIFFGIAFLLISKNLPRGSVIKENMIICAFGFIIFFISSQSVDLVIAPYPPFGLISTAFVGLSCYLILVGIYSSALSASHDTKLRESIKDLAKSESKLLDSIGRAETIIGKSDAVKEIENRVTKLTREYSENAMSETGISSSLTEQDAKDYLVQVLEEIKSKEVKK